MGKYEVVVILDAQIPAEEKNSICKECCENIVKAEGKVINSQVWLERQKFTFPMKRCLEGTYYVINVEATSQSVGKIRTMLKLNEKFLRSAIFKN